jgi:hypothetical protein
MRIIFISFAFVLMLSSCTKSLTKAKIHVKEASPRFINHSKVLYIAENNRVLKESWANTNKYGLFLDPFVEKNRKTNQITLLGFNVVHKTFFSIKNPVEGLGRIYKVEFLLTNGEVISLYPTLQKDKVTYNSLDYYIPYSFSYNVWESGMLGISKEKFERILLAQQFSCKIFGSKRIIVYEEKDISPNFVVRLRNFYDQYMK